MITKITVDFPRIFSMQKEKPKGVYGEHDFEDKKFIRDTGEHLVKIADMIGYLEQYPETKPETLINLFIPKAQVTVKNHTKKRRTYSFWLCYLHEEDIIIST